LAGAIATFLALVILIACAVFYTLLNVRLWLWQAARAVGEPVDPAEIHVPLYVRNSVAPLALYLAAVSLLGWGALAALGYAACERGRCPESLLLDYALGAAMFVGVAPFLAIVLKIAGRSITSLELREEEIAAFRAKAVERTQLLTRIIESGGPGSSKLTLFRRLWRAAYRLDSLAIPRYKEVASYDFHVKTLAFDPSVTVEAFDSALQDVEFVIRHSQERSLLQPATNLRQKLNACQEFVRQKSLGSTQRTSAGSAER
jgi:hypothetical protein